MSIEVVKFQGKEVVLVQRWLKGGGYAVAPECNLFQGKGKKRLRVSFALCLATMYKYVLRTNRPVGMDDLADGSILQRST